MNTRMLSTAVAIVFAAIFGIATTSIAIECYNSQNAKIKEEKPSNFNFVVFNLVCNILMLILGFVCIYMASQSPV